MWGTPSINTLKFNPGMPYHDPEKKYVNYMYSFSDGFKHSLFMDLMQDTNIEQLKEERGISMVYTHFADGFVEDSVLKSGFKNQVRKITRDPEAWLAPASTILDRLLVLKNLTIHEVDDHFFISNCNNESVPGLTLMTQEKKKYYNHLGKPVMANEEGEILLGSIEPKQTIILSTSRSSGSMTKVDNDHDPGILETGAISIDSKEGIKNTGLFIQEEENAYIIINSSTDTLWNIPVFYSDDSPVFAAGGKKIEIIENHFLIDNLNPMENYVIYKDSSILLRGYTISKMEEINLLWGRILVFLQDGFFLQAKWWRK